MPDVRKWNFKPSRFTDGADLTESAEHKAAGSPKLV